MIRSTRIIIYSGISVRLYLEIETEIEGVLGHGFIR